MNSLKLGIVGLGNMGTQHYQSITQQFVKRVEVTAVCDLDPNRLSSVSPGIARFSDGLEMIESGLIAACCSVFDRFSLFFCRVVSTCLNIFEFDFALLSLFERFGASLSVFEPC